MELNFLEKNCWFVGATSVDRPSAEGSFHQWRSRSSKHSVSRVVKGAYDFVKNKNRSREWSHKLDGIGVGRIRPFPFYYNFAYDRLLFTI